MYYPHGSKRDYSDFMSVYLDFKSQSGKPRASCSFSLLDYVTGEAAYTLKAQLHTFETNLESNWGYNDFLERKTFEASNCLWQDSLTIICDVTVLKEPVTYSNVPITVPISPSNIHERLGALLSSKKGVDIIFEVAGKSFHAHKTVLAASSPVFEAQLFGQMGEAKKNKIKISDMKAPVFQSMLHFIYNDMLPHDNHADAVMTQHLLVAADRYMLEKLRLTCERKLCESLDMSSVGTTLALAEQHNLTRLKTECLRYLECPEIMRSVIKTDGFEHLLKSCPSVVKDIINKIF